MRLPKLERLWMVSALAAVAGLLYALFFRNYPLLLAVPLGLATGALAFSIQRTRQRIQEAQSRFPAPPND